MNDFYYEDGAVNWHAVIDHVLKEKTCPFCSNEIEPAGYFLEETGKFKTHICPELTGLPENSILAIRSISKRWIAVCGYEENLNVFCKNLTHFGRVPYSGDWRLIGYKAADQQIDQSKGE